MGKRRVRKTSCFALGVAGSVITAGAGGLVAAGQGAASYLRIAGFVLFGAMLLFLAAAERGDDKKTVRIKLIALFLGWMVAWFPLPPLEGLFGCLIPVIFTGWYRRGALPGLWVAQLVAELAYGVIITLAIMPWFGAWHNLIVGGSLLLAGLLRAGMLAVLYRQAAAAPPEA